MIEEKIEMKLDTKEFEARMKKSISVYEEDLDGIRVGRANPSLLAKINVDYYGSPTPINNVAEVKVTDARTIVIQPWEAKLLKDIGKAIQASDLGITPIDDGKVIRLCFPALNEERRREVTKQTEKLGEEAKVAIRNIRRDANDRCKEMKKANEMTEDEVKQSEKAVQDLTDKYIKEIDSLTEAKKKEIMSI